MKNLLFSLPSSFLSLKRKGARRREMEKEAFSFSLTHLSLIKGRKI
jgi:hypothetical protein